MRSIESWEPVGSNATETRINPDTGVLEARVVYHKGPTPKIGGNGQLELLLRTLKDQRREERLAKLALKLED